MQERPIIFSTDMVEAILAGQKTQTRRVIMPQPEYFAHDGDLAFADKHSHPAFEYKRGIKKTYEPGDRLYVRERFYPKDPDTGTGPFYCAKHPDEPQISDFDLSTLRWKPSIHMPKAAARLWIKVIDVRVERLQEISEEDAQAEGVAFNFTQEQIDRVVGLYGKPEDHGYRNYLWHGEPDVTAAQVDAWPYQYSTYKSARDSFSSLWQKINAKRGWGWKSNPWVWVVEFEPTLNY